MVLNQNLVEFNERARCGNGNCDNRDEISMRYGYCADCLYQQQCLYCLQIHDDVDDLVIYSAGEDDAEFFFAICKDECSHVNCADCGNFTKRGAVNANKQFICNDCYHANNRYDTYTRLFFCIGSYDRRARSHDINNILMCGLYEFAISRDVDQDDEDRNEYIFIRMKVPTYNHCEFIPFDADRLR